MTEEDAIGSLVAALLPGGHGFPAASAIGIAPSVADRLRRADPDLPARIRAAVGPANAASQFEAAEPALFAELRKYAYLTYYEHPDVIAAIRALGHPYNDSPLPGGYPDDPFDRDRDAPRRPVGRWLDTDEVRPVDLSGLEFLRP